MHNSSPGDAGQRGGMAQKGVHQRAAPISAARVNDQACGLIDHEDIRILEYDRQRDLLCCMLRDGWHWRWRDDDDLTSPYLGLCGRKRTIQRDVSASHPILQSVARVFRHQPGEGYIKPHTRTILGNDEPTQRVTRRLFDIIRKILYGFRHET